MPPKPTPTEILKRRGSWRAKLRHDDEPRPEPGTPEPPDWLTDDERGHFTWLAEQLVRIGVLAEIDGPTLTVFVRAYAEWERLTQHISTLEPGSDEYRGMQIQAKDAYSVWSACGGRLGLSPADRTRIRATVKQATPDPADEFFKPIGKERFGRLG